jgi:antitoxin component YwqK of YwqJK toxin-antitoxin module
MKNIYISTIGLIVFLGVIHSNLYSDYTILIRSNCSDYESNSNLSNVFSEIDKSLLCGSGSVEFSRETGIEGESRMTIIEYVDGKYEGVYKEIRKSEDREGVVVEGKYSNGKRIGTFYHFDLAGNLMTSTDYRDGKVNGFWRLYYPDRTVFLERELKDGKLNGNTVVYFPNGETMAKGIYRNGEPFDGDLYLLRHFEEPHDQAQNIYYGNESNVYLQIYENGEFVSYRKFWIEDKKLVKSENLE